MVRDCVYVCEQEQQAWAEEMADLLMSMAKAADEWRERGAQAVQTSERDAWVAQYARPVGERLCGTASPFSRRPSQARRAAQAECRQESAR